MAKKRAHLPDAGFLAAIGVVGVLVACQVFDTAPVVAPRSLYSRDTAGLSEAGSMATVHLEDGAFYRLEAAPAKKKIGGITTRLLTYNGSFPGPLIRVVQGSRVLVRVVNRTEAPTTLHPHGLRLDYRFDGVPDYTQKAIAPGDSFEYQLDFPDAGLFWYHPHVRTDYQADAGLYGAFLVSPKNPGYWGDTVDREEVLIFDDMLLDSGGLAPYSPDGVDHALMGRFGNTLLLNGVTDYRLQVKRNERVRFFVLNAASARVLSLGIGYDLLRLVGSDYGRSREVEYRNPVLVAPAERYVFEVHLDRVGEQRIEYRTPVKYLTTGPYYKPGGAYFAPPPDSFPVLGTLEVLPESTAFNLGRSFYKTEGSTFRDGDFPFTEISQLDSIMRRPPDFFLELSVAMDHAKLPMSLMPEPVTDTGFNDSGFARATRALFATPPAVLAKYTKTLHNDPFGLGIEWYDDMPEMNRLSNAHNVRWIIRDRATLKENMDIRWRLKRGKLYHVRIWNNINTMHPMAHVMHFHGQRAMLVGTSGNPDPNPMWKDSFLIGMGKVADILLEASNPGGWMGHCHIAEHAEAGMMFLYRVDP